MINKIDKSLTSLTKKKERKRDKLLRSKMKESSLLILMALKEYYTLA